MSFYEYSVKDMLISYFGEDTILAMRRRHSHQHEDEKFLIPLMWQYADEESLSFFLNADHLLDTVLEDDYIAYLFQSGTQRKAYLMFMVSEDGPVFRMDIEYARKLVEDWTAKGYETLILRECIGVSYYGLDKTRGFRFVKHNVEGKGAALYELKCVNGKYIMVFNSHRCWEYYCQKMASISCTEDMREYECLFTDDVKITKGGNDQSRPVISKGIAMVRDFLRSSPVKIAYSEFEDTGTYFRTLVSARNELTIYVDRTNLICEINVREIPPKLIFDESDNPYGSLVARTPALVGMRLLSPEQMHGYALQLEYADDSIRNYYLHCFDTRSLPAVCDVSGYDFTREDFCSATADADGNVNFRNGYSLPRHILFYRSIRQVDIEHTDMDICKSDDITVHSLYRLPLMEYKKLFFISRYWGRPEECYGPCEPLINDEGMRTSDISAFSIKKTDCDIEAMLVCVEPTGKYGYLKDDGTWLAPPIYGRVESFTDRCAKVMRTENGVEKNFLLTPDGMEKQFNFPIDVICFADDRYLFKAENWEGEKPSPGYYYDDDDVTPGKWGVMDSEGNIIVEPKYVFAIACWDMEDELKEHSIIARFVNDKFCWGTIDREGDEIVPCTYSGLYSRWGNALAFQMEEGGLYGLMDFNGKVIVDPLFNYIEAYDPEHRLITAGDDEDSLGVYKVVPMSRTKKR